MTRSLLNYLRATQQVIKTRRGNTSIPNLVPLATAVLLVTSLSMGVPSLALSQEVSKGAKYSEASFQGNYAVVGTYGANVAQSLGTLTANNGKFVAKQIVNEPVAGSATGQRTIVSASATTTFTINSDGTGVAIITLTLSNGNIVTLTEDLLITKAEIIHGELVATELIGALEEPSAIVPGGVFLTDYYTRRPD
jgi:hypothetical protein